MRGSGNTTLDTYHFIVDWALSHKGNTPSLSQIAKGCGFSKDTAFVHLHKLIGVGALIKIDAEVCVARIEVSAPDNIHDLIEIDYA